MLVSFLFSFAFSLSISDDPNYSHTVAFTNPVCADYVYQEEVLANDGSVITQKTKNAYCSRADATRSGSRKTSPQQMLVDVINNQDTKEIFLAFLSFSDKRVLQALCDNAKNRDLKVVMILDSGTDKSSADTLLECAGNDSDVTIHYRGNVSGIDLSHMKLVITNYTEDGIHDLIFASANLSSGTVLHHENWHFMTLSSEGYFMQSHLCAMKGMLDHSNSGKEFRDFLKDCRNQIAAEKEQDASVYFAPAEGRVAESTLIDLLASANHVQIAAHRFSNKKILEVLGTKLEHENFKASLVVDDDIYWAMKGLTIGANTKLEARHVEDLMGLGLEVQFVETNHYENLLHHNKFMIIDAGEESHVFTGAGNFTGNAFTSNFENFYVFSDANVISAFKQQYDYMWSELSLQDEKMPSRLVKPVRVQ